MSDNRPSPVKDQPTVRHRLTVVEKLYHQTHGGEPTCIESTYEMQLQTDEEVYSRNTVADKTPVRLDLGWLNDKPVNQIVITNRETAPDKLIKIGFDDSVMHFVVLPGQSSRFLPAGSVMISCLHGPAKYKIQVIPG